MVVAVLLRGEHRRDPFIFLYAVGDLLTTILEIQPSMAYGSFFFNDRPPTEIYPLSLHDALPICRSASSRSGRPCASRYGTERTSSAPSTWTDRKSTRLNSSHLGISYAVFCL